MAKSGELWFLIVGRACFALRKITVGPACRALDEPERQRVAFFRRSFQEAADSLSALRPKPPAPGGPKKGKLGAAETAHIPWFPIFRMARGFRKTNPEGIRAGTIATALHLRRLAGSVCLLVGHGTT